MTNIVTPWLCTWLVLLLLLLPDTRARRRRRERWRGGLATAVTATFTYEVWLHAAQLSAERPAVLQRDDGEQGCSGYHGGVRSSVPVLRVRAAQRCTHCLTASTCKGLGCLSIGARGGPDSGAAPECTEPPVSTLLLAAVHPATPYTHTQPSTASRELCGTLSARAG
jgi:hypothetical protein